MRALSIAWKDLRHTYRNIAGLVLMLLAPLLLAFALGAAFGSGDNFSVAPVRTALVDQDKAVGAGKPAAGATLVATLTDADMADLLDVTEVGTPEAARALVDGGDADVAVIIPAGLTAALAGSGQGSGATGVDAEPVAVQVYKDPALNVGPAIVTAVVQAVVQSLDGARAAAATAALLGVSSGITDSAVLTDLASKTALAFAAQAGADALVTLDERAPEIPGVEVQKRPNVASQVLVGMMLFFMLFGAATPARSILDEHREGTLSRLFTTPAPRSVILAGKYIAVFLVVLVQAIVLVVAGRLLLGADWGELGPVIVLTLCSSLVAASLGLLTVSFVKTAAQAGAVSSAIFVFLGLISGNFTGGVNIGGAYAIVQKISPLGWLLQAWKDLLYGGSWGSIALPVVVVLGFTLVFFGLATLFFRRRYA